MSGSAPEICKKTQMAALLAALAPSLPRSKKIFSARRTTQTSIISNPPSPKKKEEVKQAGRTSTAATSRRCSGNQAPLCPRRGAQRRSFQLRGAAPPPRPPRALRAPSAAPAPGAWGGGVGWGGVGRGGAGWGGWGWGGVGWGRVGWRVGF